MRNSRQVVLAAAIALASGTALADKGGGGHAGGIGSGGMSSGGMNSGGMATTPGTGSAASLANSTTGAANSGRPVGQGRITAEAAHQRNMDRAQDRLEDRDRVENENEVELENRNDANDDALRPLDRRHDER
jgi:hypothetical protein